MPHPPFHLCSQVKKAMVFAACRQTHWYTHEQANIYIYIYKHAHNIERFRQQRKLRGSMALPHSRYSWIEWYLDVSPSFQRLYSVNMSHSLTWQDKELWPCRSCSWCKHGPAQRIWSILLPKLNCSAPVLDDQHVHAPLLQNNSGWKN
jgi:hypothetical protein